MNNITSKDQARSSACGGKQGVPHMSMCASWHRVASSPVAVTHSPVHIHTCMCRLAAWKGVRHRRHTVSMNCATDHTRS